MLKPYDEYKQTNIPWLEEVPSHWECKRIKEVLIERKENNSDTKSTNILSLTNTRGVIPYSEKGNVGNKSKEKIEAYKLAYPNDIVINSMNVIIGSVGLSKYFGAVSPVYYMLYARENDIIEYFNYIFQCKTFQLSLKGLGNGILEIRMRIPMNKLNNVIISIPPREEQDQIVKYLDWQTSKINTFIKAKKKQIELLKEQKQAVINKAVTKGLDDAVPMKDSGIEWLGEVPEHWDIVRCKYLFQERTERSQTGSEQHLSMSQKLGLIPVEKLNERRMLSESYVGGKLCYKDDIVLNRLKAHLGVFALSEYDGVISPDYTVLRIDKNKLVAYIAELILKCEPCRKELRVRVRGVVEGFWRLYTDDFNTISLPIAPLEEQQTLATYLEEKTALIDKAIAVIEKEIELVSEYKTSLISSVVTGKVDVRDVAVPEFEVVEEEISEGDEGLEVDVDVSN